MRNYYVKVYGPCMDESGKIIGTYFVEARVFDTQGEAEAFQAKRIMEGYRTLLEYGDGSGRTANDENRVELADAIEQAEFNHQER